MPKRGPGKAFSYPAGNATSTSSTSGCSEQLPKSMFTSWLGLVARGRGRDAEHHVELAAHAGGSPRRVATISVEHARVADRGERHLDALLGGERLGAHAALRFRGAVMR